MAEAEELQWEEAAPAAEAEDVVHLEVSKYSDYHHFRSIDGTLVVASLS